MLLTEIASFINLATNNQLSPEQVILAMDSVQKAAFNKKLQAFLVYDKPVAIVTALTFAEGAFSPADESDIGKPVAGATSGAATLAGYVNADRILLVENVTDDFTASDSVTVTGGVGGGSLTAEHFQEAYKGPYMAPTKADYPDAPCRKIWGITVREPGQFNLAIPSCLPSDYNFRRNNNPFQDGEVNDFKKWFLFSFPPSLTTTYYWVYWRNPPDITGFSDPEELVIPEEFHLHFQQACIAVAGSYLNNQPFDQKVIEDHMGAWWLSLMAPYRAQQSFQNMTQNPRQSRGSLL